MAEILNSILPFFQSNMGGTLFCLMLIAWLSYRLNKCEDRHESDANRIGRLEHAVVSLAGRRKLHGILGDMSMETMGAGGPGPRRPGKSGSGKRRK